MSSDPTAYRTSPAEQKRIADLFELLPSSGIQALEIGARDGYFSMKLADKFDKEFALDLEKPAIYHPGIVSVQGNVTCLQFANGQSPAVPVRQVSRQLDPCSVLQACR
jgi:hypothetical protein